MNVIVITRTKASKNKPTSMMTLVTNVTHLHTMDLLQIDQNRFKRETGCVDKSGGKGRFGFNSYNLLTFAILSYNIVSNIISNVNNNANNNNNNDNLLNFGSSNVAESDTSADNSNKNMLMITVPPAGPPVVVPTGRFLSNGTIILNKGLEQDGVSWYLPKPGWKVFDNGTILYNDTWKEVGVTSFGYIDKDNQFKTIKDLDDNLLTWKKLRSLRSPRRKDQANVKKVKTSPILLKNYSVKLPFNTIDTIYNDLTVDEGSLPLVLTAISVVGPPIILQIGYILQNGDILLNQGIEIQGAYWQSPERTLYENGTIVYRNIDLIDNAKITFSSVSIGGEMSPLPNINGQKVNLSMLKKLNIRNSMNNSFLQITNSNPENTFMDDLKISIDSVLNGLYKDVKTKRSIDSLTTYSKMNQRLRFLMSFMTSYSGNRISNQDKLDSVLYDLACSIIDIKQMNITYKLLKNKRTECFIKSIDKMCNSKPTI